MGITAGSLASTLLFNLLYTVFSPLSVKLKINPLGRTMILLSGGVQGFVVNPMAGVLSDGLMSRYGRRRPFMVVGGLCIIVGLLFLAYCTEIGSRIRPSDSLTAQRAVMITALEFVMIAGSSVQTPARSLCADVIQPHQQVLSSSCVVVYSGLSGIFVNLVGGLALYKYTALSQESFVLVIGLCLIVTALTVTVVVTREEPLRERPPRRNPFVNIWQALRRLPPPVVRVLVPYALSQIATYQIGFQMTDFLGREVFHGDNAIDASPEMIKKYQEGVSWAMMCNVVNYGVQFSYSVVHTKVCDFFGLKWVYMVLIFAVACVYLLFFWVSNKIAFLFMFVPIGMASVAYLSIPQAIIGLSVPRESLGVHHGLVACFTVIGQQFSNFVIGMGGGAIWPDSPRTLIAISCVFAFLSAASSWWIVVPATAPDKEESVDDSEGSE